MNAPAARGAGPPRLTFVSMLHDLERREGSARKSVATMLADGRRLTLAVRHPLVVFADPEVADAVREARAALGLSDRTRVERLPLEETETWRIYGPRFLALSMPPRSQLSSAKDSLAFRLMMWAKMEYLGRVVEADPFGSTHVGWIDLGLAHALGPTDPAALDGVAASAPDPVRVCRMYPSEPSEIGDDWMYHVFAGGLLTAAAPTWREVLPLFRSQAERSLELGIPRFEECILATIWARAPHLFSPYWGDYADVVANYVRPTRNARYLLGRAIEALKAGRWAAALDAALPLLSSWREDGIGLTPEQALDLLHLVYAASFRTDRALCRRAAAELAAAAADPLLLDEFERRRASIAADLAFLPPG